MKKTLLLRSGPGNGENPFRGGRSGTKYIFFFSIYICLFLLIISPAFPEQVIIDSVSQFDFARTCMERGEYELAVGEFERFIQFFPNDSKIPASRRLMGICHMKAQRFDASRDIFYDIINSKPNTVEAGKALLFLGETYYQQGFTSEAEPFFVQLIEKNNDIDLKNAAFYRLGWTNLQTGRWQEASETFNRVEEYSRFFESASELAKQSFLGEDLPYKRPAYAGAMAAVMPGLGHVYVSRYRDAAVAFLLNGVFIWAAVESFNEDLDALGGILTFLEAGWYAGNIYSAVNCAHKHNRKLQNDFRKSLKDQFDLRFFASVKGRVGLSLAFYF